MVRKDLPPNTLQEFVAYAKANESKLNMAHAGVGSVSYIGCLLLNAAIGIKPTMVPFTGTAPAMNALLGGQVDYVCDPILGPLPHVRAGTLKALAIATEKRHPALPDVPTSAEAGLPEFDCAPFYARVCAQGHATAGARPAGRGAQQGPRRPARRKRLIDLGADIAEPNRRGPQAACGAGQERDRTADADPDGGERQIAAASAPAARASGQALSTAGAIRYALPRFIEAAAP